MAPRSYILGKRADSTESTRRRILDATIELYREQGVKATTIKAVAERADVSRGTILHHFGSASGLLAAVLDLVVETLQLPDERIFAGLESRDLRVRAYTEAMVAFQERSTPLWSMFESEMQRPELQEREAHYWSVIGRLQAAALGPELANDPEANAALLGLIHPATVGTLLWSYERAGLERDAALRLLGDMVVDAVRRIADRRIGKGGLQ